MEQSMASGLGERAAAPPTDGIDGIDEIALLARADGARWAAADVARPLELPPALPCMPHASYAHADVVDDDEDDDDEDEEEEEEEEVDGSPPVGWTRRPPAIPPAIPPAKALSYRPRMAVSSRARDSSSWARSFSSATSTLAISAARRCSWPPSADGAPRPIAAAALAAVAAADAVAWADRAWEA